MLGQQTGEFFLVTCLQAEGVFAILEHLEGILCAVEGQKVPSDLVRLTNRFQVLGVSKEVSELLLRSLDGLFQDVNLFQEISLLVFLDPRIVTGFTSSKVVITAKQESR
jgi:hypothetical protein